MGSKYEPAPAGEVEVEIVAASIGEVAWKASDDNPRGECLRLRLSAGREFGFIFADVPLDWRSMLENVRAAADTSSDFTPEEFIGRRARVVLKRYVGRDGTTRASVAKWLPATRHVSKPTHPGTATLNDAIADWARPTTPTKPRGPAKPSRNAPPQYGADDDIPF